MNVLLAYQTQQLTIEMPNVQLESARAKAQGAKIWGQGAGQGVLAQGKAKAKAARVVKVSQKLVRQGREKLAAKEPLEVVQWRLSRLHPVGCGFLWQRDSRRSRRAKRARKSIMVHVFIATPNSPMTASIVATVALDDWRHRWIGTKSMKFPRHTKIRQEVPRSERQSSLGKMLREPQNFRGQWRQQQVLLPPGLCLLSKCSHRNSECHHRCRRHPVLQPQLQKLERKLQKRRCLCPGKWSP